MRSRDIRGDDPDQNDVVPPDGALLQASRPGPGTWIVERTGRRCASLRNHEHDGFRRSPCSNEGVCMERAAIFDMDGVLIDSEPLWQAAEKAAFSRVGIELSDDMCRQTMGLRVDEVVGHWYSRYPWKGRSRSALQTEIIERVGAEIRRHGRAMPGVDDTLELLSARGWKIGLASSSPLALIHVVVKQLGIQGQFSALCSAFDEERGKPDPAVYLAAAKRLEVQPSRCIAFEDSPAGVASAKAANMRVVAIPDRGVHTGEPFEAADLELSSLEKFSGPHLERLICG